MPNELDALFTSLLMSIYSTLFTQVKKLRYSNVIFSILTSKLEAFCNYNVSVLG